MLESKESGSGDDALHRVAETAAKRILSGGTTWERTQDALLILLGFDVPHLREGPKRKVEKESKSAGLRQGLSELFDGWH